MPKIDTEHTFVTPNANARIVLGKHPELGVYIEASASQDAKSQWKGAMACWYEKGQRSQGLTYLPEAPLLLPVLKFMEKLEFPKEDIVEVKKILIEWGHVETKAGEATQNNIF